MEEGYRFNGLTVRSCVFALVLGVALPAAAKTPGNGTSASLSESPGKSSLVSAGLAKGWQTYSSVRWKTNIVPIRQALRKVLQLQGVYFDWKPEYGGDHDIGFIAEEVGKVVPELVVWETDGGNATGLKYDRFPALTVEAIKEQQETIEQQQEFLLKQEEMLERQEQLIQDLLSDICLLNKRVATHDVALGDHQTSLTVLTDENEARKQEIDELRAMIEDLQEQLAAVQGQGSAPGM
jgi:hypothetical protein